MLPKGAGAAPVLRCDVDARGDGVVVRPHGELDLSTTAVLAHAIQEAAARRPASIEVDLSGLTFLDSTGVKLLLDWHSTGRGLGMDFVLGRGRAMVQRTLELCGADTLFTFRDEPAAERSTET
jgi:anti-anti-sigma factor